jgi:cation diffusion facilitator family transporter
MLRSDPKTRIGRASPGRNVHLRLQKIASNLGVLSSKRVVYAAIVSNLAIALAKYLASAFTGSPAMLAEAFHSTVDCGNELLLLLGMKRSERPADALHPFGHGKAFYFYSLLVAVYIFGVGGGLAAFNGISHLRHPAPSIHTGWSYAVLAFAAAFDLYSWRISYRELQSRKDPDESIWDEIVGSKDPSVFTVFLEDCAGLVGTFLAFAGIFIGQLSGNPYLDPIASILVGVLWLRWQFSWDVRAGHYWLGKGPIAPELNALRKSSRRTTPSMTWEVC